MQSQFSAQTLAEIFRDLYVGEKSGVLVLNRDDVEKHVVFARGMILFAESSVDEEKLGFRLVRGGALSAGALAEAAENLDDEASSRDLAQILVNRDLIVRSAVCRAEREIVRTVVDSVFGWEGGSARFHESEQSPGVFDTDILTTLEIMLHGILCMAGFGPIHEAMKDLDNRLRFRRPTSIPVERLTLSPAHGFILSRVDGNTSLHDVIAILPPGEEEVVSRFLFGLLVLGVLEYDPPLGSGGFKVADLLRDHADRHALERMQEQTVLQAYAQIREQNPHEILGLPPSAPREQLEQAYERTKAQFARDRLLPRVREKLRSELTLIESRLIESFLTLANPAGAARSKSTQGDPVRQFEVQDLNVRVEMDKPRAKVALEQAAASADLYFAKARQAIREGDFHNAIQLAKLAISHNASDARYYCLLADCQIRNPEARWQRMAEENYIKATQFDPWNAEYRIHLGRLYKKQGLRLRARKQFDEALKLVPNSDDVLAEIRELG